MGCEHGRKSSAQFWSQQCFSVDSNTTICDWILAQSSFEVYKVIEFISKNKQWRFFGVWCLVGARVWFMFQANYWEITRSSWYIVCLFMIDHIHLYLWFSNVYTICKQSDNQPVKWYNLLHLCIWDVMPWCLKWWRINNCLVHSVNINKINCMWSTTCITVFWCCCFRNDSIKLWT